MDVFLVVIQNLLLAGGLPLWIVIDRLSEAGHVFVTLVLGKFGHLTRDTRYFLEPNLMDLGGRDVDCSHLFHRFGIAPFPVREGFDRKLGSSLRIVFSAQELGEFFIGGKYIVVDRLRDFVGQAFFVLLGKFRRKFFGGFEERICSDDAVALAGQL